MARGLKRIDSISKDVEQVVRRTSVMLDLAANLPSGRPGQKRILDSCGHVRLTDVQNHIYHDALIVNSLIWHDTLLHLGYTEKQFNYALWLESAIKVPVVPLLSSFKSCDQFLLRSVENDDCRLGTFKGFLKSLNQDFVNDIISKPLNRALVGWFSRRDPSSFAALHQCFSFMTRLNLPGREDLEMAAGADYIRSEDSLKLSGFTTWEEKIISSWFPVSSEEALFNAFWPQHGPGSVADTIVAEKLLKYKAMGTDHRIRFLSGRMAGRDVSPTTNVPLDRCSRVVFVPKSFDKLRTICMEPATLQWYQQGFLHAFNDYVNKHSYLRRRIDLSDQERSRELARLGSIDGRYATFDLTAASDSVSWPLVRHWTSHSGLRYILMCTRSLDWEITAKYSPTSESVRKKTNRFAPMGSAMCFPTEGIVFCSQCEASILEDGGRPQRSKYVVFGDDIIIETVHAETLLKRLTQNGFKVNTSKSFTIASTHNFRESCGGEYLDGLDVRPVRISRKFSGFDGLNQRSSSRVSALIDLATDLIGHTSARSYVIAALNKLPQDLRPLFDEDGSKGIKSLQPTNHHLALPKYNASLQNFEVTHGIPLKWEDMTYDEQSKHASTRDLLFYRNTADEAIRFYEWARLSAHRDRLLLPEDLILAETISPGEPRLTKSKSVAGPHSLAYLIREVLGDGLKTVSQVQRTFDSLKRLEWVLRDVQYNVPSASKLTTDLIGQVNQFQRTASVLSNVLQQFVQEKEKGS